MPKIISLACLLFGTSVEDALAGATVHGARALGMLDAIGTLEPGKQADIVVCEVDNYKKIPYYFGEDIVSFTIKKGRCIYGKNR
jgi:imidazolonepropionase